MTRALALPCSFVVCGECFEFLLTLAFRQEACGGRERQQLFREKALGGEGGGGGCGELTELAALKNLTKISRL